MIDKKALVIGIDAYPGNRLYGCVRDAKEFAELIRWNGDGNLNSDTMLYTDVPTKAQLTQLITEFFTGDTGTAILYYSGHGYLNEQGGYLVTADASAFDEGLSMDRILQIANTSASRNKVIILDCCNSGAFAEPRLLGGVTTHVKEGLTILTASRKDQNAIEVNGHGVFTNLLLEALRGGAANITGHISPASVYAFIDQALSEHEQRPVFKTNITRFISLREVPAQVPQKILWKIREYFPAPDHLYPLNPSYEFTNTEERRSMPIAPFARQDNVDIFKHLQKMQSVGLVVPVDAPFMYFAAMESKSCRLTPLGQHYWRLASKMRIY